MKRWLGLALLWPVVGASAEEWPRWRGSRGDGISHERLAEAWPSTGPTVAWRANTGAGYSSPIAYEGRIYLFQVPRSVSGASETLTAYDADSGRVIWSETGGGSFEGGRASEFPGTRATPAIDEASRSIVTFGSTGELIRRDLATGRRIWRTNVLDAIGARNLEWGTASSPLVVGDRIFVQGGREGAVAVAVDRETGRVAWTSAYQGTSGPATPVLAEAGGRRQLLVLAEEAIVAMDVRDGTTLWSEPWYNGYAMPIVRGDRVFVTSARGLGAMMLEFSGTGARHLWTNRHLTSRFNPPVLDGDYLYGNSEGILACVRWEDGALQWRVPKPEYLLGFGGSLVRTGDLLLLLGDRGMLSLVRATGQAAQTLGQTQLVGGADNWATPLLYRGRVYVRGGSHLLALRLGAQPAGDPLPAAH